MTGNERLTSEIFGAPFAKPHSTVTIGGPWAFDGATPAIVGFPADEGGDTAGLVLPSSDLDDAWALPREHVLAAGTGAITADGSRIAYLDTADNDTSSVVVLDGFTGQQLGFYHAPETDDVLQVVGLTGGDSKLILRDNQQVWTVDLATGEIATAFDPDGDIHELAFDPTTGTAIASAGDDAFAWLDPATGAVKALDIPVPLRSPMRR